MVSYFDVHVIHDTYMYVIVDFCIHDMFDVSLCMDDAIHVYVHVYDICISMSVYMIQSFHNFFKNQYHIQHDNHER